MGIDWTQLGATGEWRRFGAIPASWDWSDRPLFIVGTGPSLRGVDLSGLPDLGRVLAVKEAAFDLPHADAAVCADWRWPIRRFEAIQNLTCPTFLAVDDEWGLRLPKGNTTLLHRLHNTVTGYPAHWSYKRDALAFGCTSGYAALNLAVLAGAKRICLLGYDYGHTQEGPHHANDRQDWYAQTNRRHWPAWADFFFHAVPILQRLRVQVINCCPQSAIRAFPREQVLAFSDLRWI